MGAALFAALILPGAPAEAAHPLALWHVVHDLCVPDRKLIGLSAPCDAVDLKAGYAVVSDPGAVYDLLVVPTRQVTGIEDPYLRDPSSPNYWQAAWSSRWRLARRLGFEPPRQALGVAVNAIDGRSQDQLHLHLSCIRTDVADTLKSTPAISDAWTTLTVDGAPWRVRHVVADDLTGEDPFKLLAADVPGGSSDAGGQTLVVIGASLSFGPGFYLLHRASDLQAGSSGHGEALLDERCSAIRG